MTLARWLRDRRAEVLALVTAAINAAQLFDVTDWTPDQIASVNVLAGAVIAVIVGRANTPRVNWSGPLTRDG